MSPKEEGNIDAERYYITPNPHYTFNNIHGCLLFWFWVKFSHNIICEYKAVVYVRIIC